MSTDKDKYGIRLRAEPDHMVLGKRLKGAFKSVTASIKELSNEQLEAFQKTGKISELILFLCSFSSKQVTTHTKDLINKQWFCLPNKPYCGEITFILPNTQLWILAVKSDRQTTSLSSEGKP